ncbi:MAG: hypothetical protein Q9173_003252, partial [Seirophora scorigena]
MPLYALSTSWTFEIISHQTFLYEFEHWPYPKGLKDLIGVDHGVGKPISTLNPADISQALGAFWGSQILYELTINLTKMSILFLYLRVFPSLQNPRFTRAVVAVMRFIAMYMFISIVVTIFQCNPIKRRWDHSIPGRCIDMTAFWYANSTSNIISAAVTLGLPVKMIWNLQLPRSDKVGLYIVFGLGT